MSDQDPSERIEDGKIERIGPYRVGTRLAKGGMGEVYRGYDERLDRPVALKRILSSNADSERIQERFRREARLAARLNHPAIVQVFDWLEEKGENWLVMELVDGAPLSEVALQGGLSLRQQVACALGVAEGLEAAHRAGIIHRDLKLSNVMLTEDGVKILDFGIAKSLAGEGRDKMATLTQEGVVMGSLSSMSPEQALGQKVDHRSDLFSLGSLIYELLTGIPPFKAKNASETLIRIYSWEHLPIEERSASVPYPLCRLVDRLLEKEPANRPLDASRVVQDLEEVATELGGLSSRIFKAGPELEGAARAPQESSSDSMEPTLVEGMAMHTTQADGTRRLGRRAGADPADGDGSMDGKPEGKRPSSLAVLAVPLILLLGMLFLWNQRDSGPAGERGDAAKTAAATDPADGSVDGSQGSGAMGKATALAPQRDHFVVLPFENRTGDPELEALGWVIADGLARDLSHSAEVVPLELAVRAVDLASRDSGDGDRDGLSLPTVASETLAGTVVSGAYYLSGSELILRGQIHDAKEERVLFSLDPLRAPVEDPIAGLELLTAAVRSKLAMDFDLAPAPEGRSGAPAYSAYRPYVEGLAELWQLDFEAAAEKFDRAARLAPSFPWSQLMAAEARLGLGAGQQASELLAAVEPLRESLPPLDRLRLDWLRAASRGNYRAAANLADAAAQHAPNSKWPFVLGTDSLRANQPRRAWSALVSLDPERGYCRGRVLYFEFLTLAQNLLGDHEAELLAAQHGRQLYPESLIALGAEARALVALGRLGEAFERLDISADMPPEMAVDPGAIRARIAYELAAHGHSGDGWEAAEMALDWYRGQSSLGEREGEARVLFFLQRYQQADVIARSLAAADPERADLLGLRGVLADLLERRAESEAWLAQLEGWDPDGVDGDDEAARAQILAWRGEKEKATELFKQALAAGYLITFPRLHPRIDPMWQPLHDDPEFIEAIAPRG